MSWSVRTTLVALMVAPLIPHWAHAQAAAATKTQAKAPSTTAKTQAPALSDSARADSAARAFLEADAQYYERRLLAQRVLYLKGAAWANLGDRCNPGSLRVFPNDTAVHQRDSLQILAERMESTLIGRGVGARLDTPAAQVLLRTIVGWEAGIDRPLWDVDTKESRIALAAGLTGEYADPKGTGCLPSPMAADTVTFVIPGFTTMEFPNAKRPRVKAYFGPLAQSHARDDFFAAKGSKDPQSELSYILVAPVLMWRDWALVGVDRPREKAGVEIGKASNGGAVYLMRRVGQQWRLLTIVRTWGS